MLDQRSYGLPKMRTFSVEIGRDSPGPEVMVTSCGAIEEDIMKSTSLILQRYSRPILQRYSRPHLFRQCGSPTSASRRGVPARCFPFWRNDDFIIFHEKMRCFPYWRNDNVGNAPVGPNPPKLPKPIKPTKPTKPDFEISGFLVHYRVSQTS